MTYVNGDSYDGQWEDGMKHGKGKMTFASGTSFDGEWKDDHSATAEGRTAYTDEDSHPHSAAWKNGVKQ